jgi:hypothetical protein
MLYIVSDTDSVDINETEFSRLILRVRFGVQSSLQVGMLVLLLHRNWDSPLMIEVVSDKCKISQRELVEVNICSVDVYKE